MSVKKVISFRRYEEAPYFVMQGTPDANVTSENNMVTVHEGVECVWLQYICDPILPKSLKVLALSPLGKMTYPDGLKVLIIMCGDLTHINDLPDSLETLVVIGFSNTELNVDAKIKTLVINSRIRIGQCNLPELTTLVYPHDIATTRNIDAVLTQPKLERVYARSRWILSSVKNSIPLTESALSSTNYFMGDNYHPCIASMLSAYCTFEGSNVILSKREKKKRRQFLVQDTLENKLDHQDVMNCMARYFYQIRYDTL